MAEAKSPSDEAHLRKIRLELARSKDHVSGWPLDGYEFVAPLGADHHIDVEAWKQHRALCFVHRIESGATVERGLLIHRAGGAGGATWAFEYDGDEGEDSGHRFGAHAFTPGEYVSLRDEDGELVTYRVAAVGPA